MAAKYDRLELIGSGTFGKVYLVRSKESNRQYVLKEINLTNMSGTEKYLALTEVTVLARCRHKNIIRYKEAILEQEKGMLSIVMEYAEYGDMYAAIKRQRGVYFPETDVLSWFIQITLALQYIHNHNILHRDLKTQNIFLTGDKIVKVGDFGIAKVLKEDQELARTAIGTPYYLSPEICQRKPYNSKSDIWALGCILFEITALVHPFQGQNFHQLVKSILKVQYKKLPSLQLLSLLKEIVSSCTSIRAILSPAPDNLSHCSTLIQDLVEVLLDLDPEKRPSADEILAIPSLQAHIRRYLDVFSSLDSLNVIDSMVITSLKKNEARRFSSNDILDVPRPPSLKRTSSVSAVGKNITKSQNQNISKGDGESSSKPSKILSNFYRQSKRISGSRPTSSPHADTKKEKSKSGKSTCTTCNETPESQHTQKDNGMKQTYSLWKKAVEKGERAIGIIGNKMFKDTNYNHQRSGIGTELDCGYQSGEPSSQSISKSSHVGKKPSLATSENPKQLKSNSSEPHQDNVMDVLSGVGVNYMDDVFDMECTNDGETLNCPHTYNCQCCIFETLWKNRIKTTGDFDDTERSRLRRTLQRVLGKNEFDHLYRALSRAWNNDGYFAQHSIIRELSFEQKQHIPLLMQLLQMDFVAITRSPLYLDDPL